MSENPKFYLNMSARTRLPAIALDLLVIAICAHLFFQIGVFSVSALIAFGALLGVFIIFHHRWVWWAKRREWNFVELRDSDFVVRTAQSFGPADKVISYDNVEYVQTAERISLTWLWLDRYTFADFWPHTPPATTLAGWFGPAPHVEIHLRHAMRIPLWGNRLFPFVKVLHVSVDNDALLSAQLMAHCGLP